MDLKKAKYKADLNIYQINEFCSERPHIMYGLYNMRGFFMGIKLIKIAVVYFLTAWGRSLLPQNPRFRWEMNACPLFFYP